jgi:soluble lytic murein transglycosylase-like protein
VSVKRQTKEKRVTRSNFRIICDCQRHRRPRSLSERARKIVSRAAAIVVSVPLALVVLDPPTVAMDLDLAKADQLLRRTTLQQTAPEPEAARTLPVFTTDAIRSTFLEPAREPLTLDIFKERYFRQHVPYGAIIYREARRHDLAPELVAAMVHTESDFRSTLVSHKSAQGLMQIVPETARLLGIRNPFDPEENIAAGTRYYRYLLNRFDDQNIALAAYNAGEGNVERFGGIPPFSETQSYVTKVNRRAQRYRQRVHNGFLASVRIMRSSVH